MIRKWVVTTALVLGVFAMACDVNAQQSGSAFGGINTSSGLFGSRNLGQGISGGGGSAFGGTPGNLVEQAQAGAGEVQGGERFTRDGRQAGQFVGADSGDAANFFGQSQGFAGSGLEQLLGRAAQRDFQNQGNAAGSSRAPLRPALMLGFQLIPPAQGVVSDRMSQRLMKLPNLEILEAVSVSMADRTAILRGRVATEHDRRMIAQIALLEPGVSNVQNELQVGSQTQPASESPAFDPFAPFGPSPGADDNVRPIPPPIPDDAPATVRPGSVPGAPVAPTAPSADD